MQPDLIDTTVWVSFILILIAPFVSLLALGIGLFALTRTRALGKRFANVATTYDYGRIDCRSAAEPGPTTDPASRRRMLDEAVRQEQAESDDARWYVNRCVVDRLSDLDEIRAALEQGGTARSVELFDGIFGVALAESRSDEDAAIVSLMRTPDLPACIARLKRALAILGEPGQWVDEIAAINEVDDVLDALELASEAPVIESKAERDYRVLFSAVSGWAAAVERAGAGLAAVTGKEPVDPKLIEPTLDILATLDDEMEQVLTPTPVDGVAAIAMLSGHDVSIAIGLLQEARAMSSPPHEGQSRGIDEYAARLDACHYRVGEALIIIRGPQVRNDAEVIDAGGVVSQYQRSAGARD